MIGKRRTGVELFVDYPSPDFLAQENIAPAVAKVSCRIVSASLSSLSMKNRSQRLILQVTSWLSEVSDHVPSGVVFWRLLVTRAAGASRKVRFYILMSRPTGQQSGVKNQSQIISTRLRLHLPPHRHSMSLVAATAAAAAVSVVASTEQGRNDLTAVDGLFLSWRLETQPEPL